MEATPCRQIRAFYTDRTIRVYQAYSGAIADSALAAGRFVSPPFKMDRMTWIKPSFLWMMYRSGWATKPGQGRILGIDISREGFEWALSHSCLSDFDTDVYSSREEWEGLKTHCPVRVQWDPERDIALNRLEYRSLQVGLTGEAVERYIAEWIHRIEDLTGMVAEISRAGESGARMLPIERPYPLPDGIAHTIGSGQPGTPPDASEE